jgi:hypothetical protein
VVFQPKAALLITKEVFFRDRNSIGISRACIASEKKKDTFKKGNEVSKFEKKKSKLVERDLREAAFAKAGLTQEISKMDELDRDLLFYKAKNNTVDELKKEYPSIDIEKIKKLKQL